MSRRIFGDVSDEDFTKVLYRTRKEGLTMAEVMSAAMYAYGNNKIDIKEWKEYYEDLKRKDMCARQNCNLQFSKEEEGNGSSPTVSQ
jgi:hypothetical protein